jgi:hypothetical protein
MLLSYDVYQNNRNNGDDRTCHDCSVICTIGKAYVGKIKDMPVELMSQWAAQPHGERRIRKAVEEAEDVFLRALFESKIEDEEKQGDSANK